MSRLDDFWSSKENQEKYGFECHLDSQNVRSIYYDGDIRALIDIAYKAAGYTTVEDTSEIDDSRPLLEIVIDENGNLVMKTTGNEIETGVDGEGKVPNFYIRFTQNGVEHVIRFNMRFPELYPCNEAYPLRFSMESLSSINTFFEYKYEEFTDKWKSVHPDDEIAMNRIPNYRAINRI